MVVRPHFLAKYSNFFAFTQTQATTYCGNLQKVYHGCWFKWYTLASKAPKHHCVTQESLGRPLREPRTPSKEDMVWSLNFDVGSINKIGFIDNLSTSLKYNMIFLVEDPFKGSLARCTALSYGWPELPGLNIKLQTNQCIILSQSILF